MTIEEFAMLTRTSHLAITTKPVYDITEMTPIPKGKTVIIEDIDVLDGYIFSR